MKTRTLQEIQDEVAHEWFKANKPNILEEYWKFQFIPNFVLINELWPEVCRRAQLEMLNKLKEEFKQRKELNDKNADTEKVKTSEMYYLGKSSAYSDMELFVTSESNIVTIK